MKSLCCKLIGLGALAALLWLGVSQPGAAQTPKKEKDLSFQTNSIPWKELFNWLSDRTGMPVFLSGNKVPTGSLNIISPKNTKYTLPQVMDLINESLMEQKYLLVRRAKSFVLVSSEKKLPASLVPRIDVKDLDKRGQTEVVSVKLQPKVVVADITTELGKLKGPFGEITAFDAANQLVVQDTVENIERIIKHVEDIEKVVTSKVENQFKVIALKHANAMEVAKILDDGFNGGKSTISVGGGPPGGGGNRGRGRGPGGGGGGMPPWMGGGGGGEFPFGPGMFGGGNGGGDANKKQRINVIPDVSGNKLLIKADPPDMAAIETLISKHLDVEEKDSNQLIKTFILGATELDEDGKPILDKNKQPKVGPLKYTNADDVANVIRDVYRESMNTNPVNQRVIAGGWGGWGGGQGPQQKMGIDANGNPKGVMLSLGVDNRTNTLIVACPTPMKNDLQALVDMLEDAAMNATTVSGTQVVEVVQVKGVDPKLLQQAIDAIQGRRTTGGTTGGMNTGGFPFGGGMMQRPGGFGFGGPPGGGPGGGRPRGGGMQSRGPDFFVPAVKDDHLVTKASKKNQVKLGLESDPEQANLFVSLDPDDGSLLVAVEAAQAAVQGGGKDKGKGKTPPKKGKEPDSVQAPKNIVEAQALPELGIFILRAQNPQDLEAARMIIKLIQEAAKGAELEIQVVPLRHADATSVTTTLNKLFERIVIGPNFTSQITGPARPATPAPGVQPPGGQPGVQPPQQPPQQPGAQAAGQQAASVILIPLPRQNSILLAAPKARMEDMIKEIQKLDQPNVPSTNAVPFQLKRASAAKVANTVNSFYANRYSPEAPATNQIRVFSDDASNTVYVQASPADLDEIRRLIQSLDTLEPKSENIIRVVPLRNGLSDDMAALILRAIAEGPITPGTAGQTTTGGGGTPAGPGPGTGPGGGPFGPGAGPGQTIAPGATAGTTQQQRQSKAFSLSFISTRPDGQKFLTGILDDIRIISDTRLNALIISAPEKTMQLILALVGDLDVPPQARADINVFQLKNADATQMALTLQQLFLGATGAGTGIPRTTGPGTTGPTGPTGPGITGTGAGTGRPLQIMLEGKTAEGAPLIDLRITVDEQTNSLIVAGSKNDLNVIYSIVNRIDDADRALRKNGSIRLHNAMVADVAATLTDFFTKGITVYRTGATLSNYQEILRDVVLSTDPITNTLLISASPTYFDEIVCLAHKLDFLPQQVMIDVMVAECDYEDDREIGVELGLQSPVLFRRSIFTSPTTGPALVPQGVTVNNFTNPPGLPGFLFNDVTQALGNNTNVVPGLVGFQGLTNLGTGQISPNNNFGGFVFHASSNSVSVLIRALEVQKRLKILSDPKVMTVDNQTALINVSKSIPLNAGSSVTATGIVTSNIIRQTVGVILQVTPKITLDGQVVMRIIPEISSVDPQQISLGNGQTGTVLNIQHLETTAVADDGETIVLGGMITDSHDVTTNKVPCLGDLPYLGALFRYRTTQLKKVELLLIMTPHIINGRKDTERILAEEAAKMGWDTKNVVGIHGWRGMEPALQDVKTAPAPPFAPDSMIPGAQFIPAPADPGLPPESLPTPRVLPGSANAPLLIPNVQANQERVLTR